MDSNKYTEAEFRLAELLGWTPFVTTAGTTNWINPETELPDIPPDWIGDNDAAFGLMLQQNMKVDCTDTDERFICYVHISSRHSSPYVCEHYEDHKDHDLNYDQRKELTVRFAIVRAAILKLEIKLEKKTEPGDLRTHIANEARVKASSKASAGMGA